jgi:predicted lipoprotein with Yx(FWY)xxD motif
MIKRNPSKKPIVFTVMSIFAVLVLAACQAATTPAPTAMPTSAPVVPTATNVPAKAEATINLAADPKLGNILVDGKGLTLYMFTKDEPNKSNCAGGCLKAWPPLLAVDKPTVGAGVDASLLGTAALPDGSMIVTYNKMPLYYYAGDTKPGDTTGQDVSQVWYVVSPDGKPVGMK